MSERTNGKIPGGGGSVDCDAKRRERRLRRRAWLRFGFGNAQMFSAAVALVLLIRDGVTATTLAAVAAACGVALLSRILFAREPARWPEPSAESPSRRIESNVPPTTRSFRL